MNSFTHDEPYAGCYVLSQVDYEELCEIRDKLLLMAQLAGTAQSPSDSTAMLFIRRALLGQLFADLSFQIRDVLDGITHVTAIAHRVQTH